MNNNELIERLKQFVTPERFEMLSKTLNNRTRYMTMVLENVYHTHNSSAVIRTCECFGIQDLNIIENNNDFIIHPDIVRGAAKWLTINQYNEHQDNTPLAIDELRQKGYRIVATTPHVGNDVNLFDFDVKKGPFAIIIGSEKHGVSDYVKENADEFLKIPMVGFTESLNLSVTAAIIMNDLRRKIELEGIDASLATDEKEALMVQWLLSSIRSADEILMRIMAEN